MFAVDRLTNTLKAQSGLISLSLVNTRFPFTAPQSKTVSPTKVQPQPRPRRCSDIADKFHRQKVNAT